MTSARLRGRLLHPSLLVPIFGVALLVGIFALPDLLPAGTNADAGGPPLTAYRGRIVALLGAHRPDPAAPGGGFLPDVKVAMLEGPQTGQELDAYLQGPGGQQNASGYAVGQEVVVSSTKIPDGPVFVAVNDRWRLPQLAWLAFAFAAAAVVIGGWRGARALLALGLTIALILRVMIPLILQGLPPIPIAVLLATAITIITIVLTEGLSRASTAAILGTAGALGFTALLAAATTNIVGFSNAAGEDLAFLQVGSGQGLDLRGLLLAAFILGSIGVLDDVTVTQAATVEELATHAGLRGRALFRSAFNVGRSHIAATVNTLFLAYVGASLPLLVLIAVSRQPTALTLNGEVVAVEIVRTLVGSLGIIAAVPATTAIAVWLSSQTRSAPDAPARPGPARALRRPIIALGSGLIAIGLATAAVALLLGPLVATSPRAALAEPSFNPGSGGPGFSPAPSGSGSPGPSESPSPEVTIIAIGDTVTATDAAGGTASVAVLEQRQSVAPGGGVRISLHIRYQATRPFVVRPGAWVGLSTDGLEVPAKPASEVTPALAAAPLAAGATAEGWIEIVLPNHGDHLFLDYRAADNQALFSVGIY